MTDYTAASSNSHSADSSLQLPQSICSIDTTCYDSRTVASNDINTSEVISPVSERIADCDSREHNAQAADDLLGMNVDSIGDAESGNSCAKTFENHTSLCISADVEPIESEWKNFDSDIISNRDNDSHRSPHHHTLVHENDSRTQTVDVSTSPGGDTVSVHDAANTRDLGAAPVRKRRISAARSALYRRLLSSETAGSSDADMTGDIFDLQSLSSDDDDDASDNLNLDSSSSDHSYLVVVSVYLS